MVAINSVDGNSFTTFSPKKKSLVIFIITILALLSVGLLVTFSDQFAGKAIAGVPETRTIDIQGLAFRPAQINIDAGDTIIWVNRNTGLTHTIVATDGSFQSPPLADGQTFRRIFSTPGTFDYTDQQRPTVMTGRIMVRPAAPPASTCGNSALDLGELCDGNLFGTQTCSTRRGPGYTGSLSCSVDCKVITDTSCVPPTPCTNSATNPPVCTTCPIGKMLCGTGLAASCINTQADPVNCGSCGVVCTAGQSCNNGVCGTVNVCVNGATNPPVCTTCPTGQTLCGIGTTASCRNTQTNTSNCGTCGTVCPTGQICNAGVCRTVSALCNNGATNPPLCTNCNSTSRLVNNVCIMNCNNNATNPPVCTTCNLTQIRVANICINNCTNGALNPPVCNSCPTNKTIGLNRTCVNLCNNNATDPPRCTTCPRTLRMINNLCQRDCDNNAVNPPICNQCSDGRIFINGQCSFPCANGAIDPPTCASCDIGRTIVNGICRLSSGCTNNANNPPVCDTCDIGEVFSNGRCEITCTNGATNPPSCSLCSVGQSMINGQCAAPLVQQQVISESTTLSDQGQASSPLPETGRGKPTTQQPSSFFEQNKLTILTGGGSLLLLIVILSLFFIFRGRGGPPNPTLVNYLAKARVKGLSDEVIKTNLITAGWDEKEVQQVFK